MHLTALLQLVIAAFTFISAALLLLRSAASRFFAPFDDAPMSIGAPDPCAACGVASRHKCSRCKRARYCSPACQSKHWNSHKLNCKTSTLLDEKADTVSSDNGVLRRRKSSGLSSISLVPARGTCKVLQEPKKILYPYEEFVKLFNWDKPGFYPCGLLNCGNSCFANVVLQCLSSTRPLLAYLLERDHSRGCVRKRDDWCFLCELQAHVQRASESLFPFSPINILSRLPNIGGNLGCGRQEDAHEFMRFAIDTMQSVCLDEFGGEKAVELSSQETTLIQYIFGGYLESQVICTKCNLVSNRYENMMDLTVEIQGDAESLEECLEQFTMKEWLDGENMYKCDGCNDYVKACKQLTIHQAPNILTIALKRFQSGRFGKLNKRILFPENLDLTPYMSGNRGDCNLYTLYAVVVHVDMLNASFFGHYICYTKDYHGRWYRIDDSKVMHVEVEEVLAQGAYMLFYSRRSARREAFIKPVKPAKKCVLALAPDTSEPRPISMPQFRDTGHERNLSAESSSLDEKISDYMDLEIVDETTPVSVTEGSMDMNMDDPQLSPWEPKDLLNKSSTANGPVGTSPVKPMQSNSPLPAEISFTECQVMDCEESCPSANKSITTSSLSNSVLELCDSSKADGSMKVDLGEICTAEEASNLLKCMPKDSSSKNCVTPSTTLSGTVSSVSQTPMPKDSSSTNCVTTSTTPSATASSVSQTPDNSSHNLQQVVVASGPSVSANGLNDLNDVSCGYKGPSVPANGLNDLIDVSCGYKGTNGLASCRSNNFSRQSKPLFSPGFLDKPMRKGSAGQGNGFNHPSKINGYINGHMEIDNGKRNLHSDGVRLEPNSVNGQHILAGLDMSLVSSSSENKADYAMMSVGKNVNTNCDGSTEVELRQVDSCNGSRPEMVSNSGCSTEVDLLVSNSEDTKGYTTTGEERIAREEPGSTEVDLRQVDSCNGSRLELVSNSGCSTEVEVDLLVSNSEDTKGYTTSGEKSIARKEPDETDSCKEVNRYDFSGLQSSERRSPNSASLEVQSTHRKCAHSKSAAPYMSPGFLNKPYRRPMKVGKTDHTCNGFTEPASICQKSYKPVVTVAETNDNQPVPVPVSFGNGSNSVPLQNDLGLEVDSDAVSLDGSETSPAMQVEREVVGSLSSLKEHYD